MPRKRKRRSFGSVTTVNRGKHVIRWTQDTPQGRRRLTRTVHGTYREACAELARIQTEVGSQGPGKTVGYAYGTWYLPSMRRKVENGSMKAGTLDLYERSWRLHAGPRWADVPLSGVRPVDVQEWLLSLPFGAATASLNVLRASVDMAVKFEAVDSNRFRGRYEMPPKGSERSKAVLSLREAEEWAERLKGTPLEAPYILACFGGARTGEALGVVCSEASFFEHAGVRMALVPIVRRMDMTGDSPMPDGDLKTPQSVRTAVIPYPWGGRLLEIAEKKTDEGIGWLADRGDGLPMDRGALRARWARLGAPLPFSNLRNSWRTFAEFEWGIPTDTLEQLMGHALPGVSGRHYIRPSADALARSFAEAYAAFLRKLG